LNLNCILFYICTNTFCVSYTFTSATVDEFRGTLSSSCSANFYSRTTSTICLLSYSHTQQWQSGGVATNLRQSGGTDIRLILSERTLSPRLHSSAMQSCRVVQTKTGNRTHHTQIQLWRRHKHTFHVNQSTKSTSVVVLQWPN